MINPWKFYWILPALLLPVAPQRAEGQAPAYAPPDLKTELFGGFSSVRIKPGKNLDRVNLNAWAASVTSYQFFRRWGLTAEFGGNERDGSNQRSFLFGGTYRGLQRRRVALTGRILAGVTHWDPTAPRPGAYPQQTAFTFGFGQSIDVKFSEKLALRVQPDIRFVRFRNPNGTTSTSIVQPFSVGLVYQFGRR